jgi:hypothetical protein
MARRLALAAAVLLLLCAQAQAQIVLTFYSHKLNLHGLYLNFPHGFITLSGTTSDGHAVKANFGWTPPAVTPAILWGKVDGEIAVADDAYVAEGVRHFSLVISDDKYRAVLALVQTWRGYKQPAYDLDDRNCVSFVKAVAVTVGLAVSDDAKFTREPSEFLDDLAARNAPLIAASAPSPKKTAALGL